MVCSHASVYLLCCFTCFSVAESLLSEHFVRGHPDCCPIYGVADGVYYVDIPFEKLMGMQYTKTKWALYDFQCYSSCVEWTSL